VHRSVKRHVVIVGASLAGVRTAEALRAAGFADEITVVGQESHLPYDRPPLSKQLLAGTKTPEQVLLRQPAELDQLGVDLRLGQRATALQRGRVVLNDTEALSYSDLVIATGASARRLAGLDNDAVHTLRTLDDSIRLRDDLQRASRLIVVGAGFIGAEVAAVARKRGLEVTMVEALPTPFARALGTSVGEKCTRLHRDHGVHVVTRAEITQASFAGGTAALRLGDGTTLEADALLAGVGTRVNTEWLHGTGLDDDQGIPCDANGRVDGHPNTFAVGDVASWYSETYGDRRRFEHWTNATEQAHAVAQAIMSMPSTASHELPYFWSDQYNIKVQLIGRPDLADRVRIIDLPGKPGRMLGTYLRSSQIVAAVTFGAPAILARLRPLVAHRVDEAVADSMVEGLLSTQP